MDDDLFKEVERLAKSDTHVPLSYFEMGGGGDGFDDASSRPARASKGRAY